MVGEKGKNDGGGGTDCGGGITIKVENGESAESSCEGLQTYKRRRHAMSDTSGSKSLDADKLAAESVSQLKDRAIEDSIKRIPGISSSEQVSSRAVVNKSSDDCPSGQWRKNLLEQIYQSSCESEDGLLRCIRDALLLQPENSSNIAAKESCHSGADSRICTSGAGGPDASKGVESNESLSASNQTDTDLCRHAFKDIIMSENFAQLSRLLVENFQGVKFDSFLDIKLLNERMKDGTYEKTPMFFHSDMQKVWMKLQKVGAEMVTIGKSLSETSKTSYRKQVGGSQGCSKDAELVNGELESGANTKQQAESSCAHKDYTCQCCGKTGDGKECLVCDSCEEMYHISCIHLSAEQIPTRSWYCPNCNVHDKDLPHDDCVVCEKLHAAKPPPNPNRGDVLMEDSSSEETSDGTDDDSEKLQRCNVCRIEVNSDEEVKACGHPYCPHKYYHFKCLTIQQLSVHGPCWYCPSCLCRACLTDDDDEKIVLCDGCDHAYHIYCMQPPRDTVPRGKWFCKNCRNVQHKMGSRGGVRKGAAKAEPRDNEAMEMLLTAATQVLNQEEARAESSRGR